MKEREARWAFDKAMGSARQLGMRSAPEVVHVWSNY